MYAEDMTPEGKQGKAESAIGVMQSCSVLFYLP
jgi:hypothetical protein